MVPTPKFAGGFTARRVVSCQPSTRRLVQVFGLLIGALGAEHGVGELGQGDRPLAGPVIQSWSASVSSSAPSIPPKEHRDSANVSFAPCLPPATCCPEATSVTGTTSRPGPNRSRQISAGGPTNRQLRKPAALGAQSATHSRAPPGRAAGCRACFVGLPAGTRQPTEPAARMAWTKTPEALNWTHDLCPR